MKKTSSVHLEEDMWEEILAYKKANKLSSRNDALERMLLERRILIQLLNNNSFVQDNLSILSPQHKTFDTIQTLDVKEDDSTELEAIEESKIEDSIMNVYRNMPD